MITIVKTIEEAKLPQRIKEALIKNNITTISQLKEISEIDLYNIKGIGGASIRTIYLYLLWWIKTYDSSLIGLFVRQHIKYLVQA